ncbi:MAG: hypothetical protein EFT35_01920 [Methanophagales archaeon ANME-1-THS]|nr:MAG: hypothetical protein EFT35_01920 [Methanophagales archaeon ANME-1-THS]
MATIEEVRRVKERHEAELMGKAGVVGCAIGYKHVGGKKTDELSIICYVREKKPEGKLRKQDIIPKNIEGIPIDVVESGEIRAL